MANAPINNLKLGIFISFGLAVLVVSLYLIGKNQSFFGSNFHIKARFSNVSGLMAGNNIRFDGIQAGTVNKITVLNDTTIELDLLIENNMRKFIHSEDLVAIGNDGLMGNKVVNIMPSKIPSPLITQGELLNSKKSLETEDMMKTFSATNENVEKITESLISTLNRLNESKALWNTLNDSSIPFNLSATMHNMHTATGRLDEMTGSINGAIYDLRAGKGTAGLLLEDKKSEENVRQIIENINKVSVESAVAIAHTDSLIQLMQRDYVHGRGPVQALLRDSSMVTKLSQSLSNIQTGTAAFSQDMEALKHTFVTRRYFRKLAKYKKDTARGQ
jgi:phospholipid/cholesterol/gamma-HCH transport system substrate-binding protein